MRRRVLLHAVVGQQSNPDNEHLHQPVERTSLCTLLLAAVCRQARLALRQSPLATHVPRASEQRGKRGDGEKQKQCRKQLARPLRHRRLCECLTKKNDARKANNSAFVILQVAMMMRMCPEMATTMLSFQNSNRISLSWSSVQWRQARVGCQRPADEPDAAACGTDYPRPHPPPPPGVTTPLSLLWVFWFSYLRLPYGHPRQ
jgi:hypothetical protein